MKHLKASLGVAGAIALAASTLASAQVMDSTCVDYVDRSDDVQLLSVGLLYKF